jgi:riboflavin biosynthesis pyrimidine reductase
VTAGDWRAAFEAFGARRAEAASAPLPPVRTVSDDRAGGGLVCVANHWSTRAFDGPFCETPANGGLSIGVVFVRSRDGNTGALEPSSFGAGSVDEHLIYEGLTRVTASAVLVGNGTLHTDAFFSVWHPELVALRAGLGLARHPAQVVLSLDGRIRPDEVLLFNVPEVPVFLVTSPIGRERLAAALESRPWVTPIVGRSLAAQFDDLRARGIHRACSVGGRRSTTALVDAGLVRDLYLTTTSSTAGEPNTPWYVGTRSLTLTPVLVKEWDGEEGPVRFEQFVVAG